MSWNVVVHEVIGTLLVGVVAVSALVVAELLKRGTALPTELTRKFAHIGSGFATLLIPVFIDSSWTVGILTGGFALLMFGTHVTGRLQGVHGVGRGVGGVLWYPVTAWLTFFLVFDVGSGDYVDYAIPVLVLACADAMGAVVGKRWGRHRYEVVPGHFRSLEGSAAFFVVALVCVVVPLTAASGVSPLHALAAGALVSLLAAAYESVSVHGLDNLLVPFGVLLFLDRYLEMSSVELALQALLIAAICSVMVALRWRRSASGGGAATFCLATYTVLTLGGTAWLTPLVGLVLAFAIYERLTPMPDKLARTRYELGTALIGLTVPVVLVLLHAGLHDPGVRRALFAGYVASISCQVAVLAFMAPQHRSFRFPRIRRVLSVRDAWQLRPSAPKVVIALVVAAATVCVPALLQHASGGPARGAGLTATLLTSALGLATFVLLAATACARRACPACGNITLHGLGCCHDLELGHGDTASLRQLTFRSTYLAANSVAAVAAVGMVAAWPR